jgi:RNA polymerase sigma factor for flagellar operon FliA
MPNTHYGFDAMWLDYKAEPNDERRNRLVERYLPLVHRNAERFCKNLPDEVDLDDLASAGVFGLINAIKAFDLERGVKFETYCLSRIRGAMLDELRAMDWVPRLVRSQQKDDPEIVVPGFVSLNKKWYETDSHKDVRKIDILEDKKSEGPTRRLQRKDLMKLLTKGLNQKERIIMILYYWEGLTMKEISLTLDLSESRVSQMHSSVILRLREQLAERKREGDLVAA